MIILSWFILILFGCSQPAKISKPVAASLLPPVPRATTIPKAVTKEKSIYLYTLDWTNTFPVQVQISTDMAGWDVSLASSVSNSYVLPGPGFYRARKAEQTIRVVWTIPDDPTIIASRLYYGVEPDHYTNVITVPFPVAEVTMTIPIGVWFFFSATTWNGLLESEFAPETTWRAWNANGPMVPTRVRKQ